MANLVTSFVAGEALSATKMNELVSAINTINDKLTGEVVTITDIEPVFDLSDLDHNMYYYCSSPIQSLELNMEDSPHEFVIRFTVASSVTTELPITVNGTAYVVGDQADFEALGGLTYELSIRKSAMALGELTTFTATT